MAPAFAQFEQKYKSKITIIPVDVSNREVAEKYRQYKGSQYIPETVMLRDGKVVSQQTGAMDVAELEEAVAKALP